MAAKPPIGVVIPGYGHPQFLAEAITSACEQDTDRDIHVVVVDDGCKFPETRTTVANLLPMYGGKLHYIRQKNTRLPGARNTGIRFLLELLPDLDAIYFLDADNRISPYSIEAYRKTIGDDAEIGWAYPDISFFGLSHGENGFDTRETAPDYSVLKHLRGNISEAGSMVRADVFRKGVMYDETMIFGYEDWDFWLYALEAGFKGRRCENSGFLYRRRPESMLADSTRMGEELVSRMRRTHKKLYQPQYVMALEHEEAPYFALYLSDLKDTVLLFSDPAIEAEKISFQEFKTRFDHWVNSRREFFFPQLLLTMQEATWNALQENRELLRWLFWQMREQGAEQRYLSFTEKKEPAFKVRNASSEEHKEHVAVSIMSAAYLRSQVVDSEETIKQLPAPQYMHGDIHLPDVCGIDHLVQSEFERFEAELKERLAPVPHYIWHQNKSYAGPDPAYIRKALIRDICAIENREPFPACREMERTLVAVKDDFLTKETIRNKIVNLLKTLQSDNHEIVLLVEYASRCDLEECHYQDWKHLISTLIPYRVSDKSGIYKMYLGRGISTEFAQGTPEDMALFARQCTRVIGCGAVAMLEAFGEARLHGAPGYVLLDREFEIADTKHTTQLGKLLAYEHAVVNIATDETDYRNSLSADGFPPSKFMTTKDFYRDILKEAG
ncbi:glycosyltransferase family 2 protein [Kordiimonas sp. SCSIO 12603]|uniref:glycosyltransferase family 2 protein n=1 Tax=Kordiimonas sp. SCSIO 12603 TaxID=2829596 RepID=UPI002106CFBB|nr:glycosyltransferase family A protein [Kordiimonas sp. SCSIO 12603]UTW60049.1 glycosyltransferase family 2 protein [Kordiimonas sp. SCSIO 12603]